MLRRFARRHHTASANNNGIKLHVPQTLICTSGILQASTRVSFGFTLPRHNSPSFGYHRVLSSSTCPTEQARRAGGASLRWDPTWANTRRPSPLFCALDSLVRVSNRVWWVVGVNSDLRPQVLIIIIISIIIFSHIIK